MLLIYSRKLLIGEANIFSYTVDEDICKDAWNKLIKHFLILKQTQIVTKITHIHMNMQITARKIQSR